MLYAMTNSNGQNAEILDNVFRMLHVTLYMLIRACSWNAATPQQKAIQGESSFTLSMFVHSYAAVKYSTDFSAPFHQSVVEVIHHFHHNEVYRRS